MSVCLNDTDGDGDCAACVRDPEAPCRVSARDWLYVRLTGALIDSELVSARLDAYAHELAEEIRHHDFDANVVGVRCGCSEGLTDDAADLIDPEVSS